MNTQHPAQPRYSLQTESRAQAVSTMANQIMETIIYMHYNVNR